MRAVVIAGLLTLASCDTAGPTCGEGTTEVAGLCLPTTPDRTAACGPGTAWNPGTETCVGVDRTACGEGTMAVDQGDGTTVCVAVGTSAERAP